MTGEELAAHVAKTLEENKATDVRVYDVRGKSDIADFFVIATGAAAPHLKALVRDLPKGQYESGTPDSGWIVVDYIDVVVHVLSAEARAYYALEKLWA